MLTASKSKGTQQITDGLGITLSAGEILSGHNCVYEDRNFQPYITP